LEEWLIRIADEASGGDVGVEEFFQGVVAGHFVLFSAAKGFGNKTPIKQELEKRGGV